MIARSVSRETSTQLAAYERLLLSWNKRLNLISSKDEVIFWSRHVEDSLSLIDHLPPGVGRLMDIGSGGGLPGIPLAIATGLHVDLVEADRRKAAFLETALATLRLNGTVWAERIENTSAPRTKCLTARAVAPLNELLALAWPLLASGGMGLFIKGPQAELEIAHARKNWEMTVDLLPTARSLSSIVKVTNLSQRLDRE